MSPINQPGTAPWNRGRRIPTEILPAHEIAKLIGACSRVSRTGLRNRALIVVLWRGGLRISEALDLELRDIDLARCTLNVRHGKGNKNRMVAIDASAAAVLQQWLTKRSKIKALNRPGGGQHVFCTLHGTRLLTAYVRILLPRLAVAAGVERRVHAHQLRHSFAVEMLYERIPMTFIQKSLGHTQLSTTSRYLEHVTDPDLQAAMLARPMPQCVADVLG